MFELAGVTKRYGDVLALDAVDLEIESGTTCVLIGPSGCGKSTLLRTLIGLVQPDQGRVNIDSERATAKRWPELRQRIGYVVQDGGLFPHLTARDNVTLMARQLGWTEARIAERTSAQCALTSFPTDALTRYPGELSGGQNQRVALMRALFLDPQVLLLDEPLGALDPMIRHGLQVDLKSIFDKLHKTVVMVTHDLAEAAYFADQIILLRDGQVVQSGSAESLMQRPAEPFVTRFVQAQRAQWAAPDAQRSP